MANFAKYVVTFFFVALIFWVTLPNRESISFSLYPFFENIPISVAIIFVCGVFLGFVWGGMIVWLNGANLRQSFRSLRRRLKMAEKTSSPSKNIVPKL